MKTKPECIQCMFSDLIGAIKAENLDEKLSFKIIKECLNFLSNRFSENYISSYYITYIHRIFKDLSKCEVPFKETREKSNIICMNIAERIKVQADDLREYDKFYYLLKWSVVANSIDFRTAGISYNFSFEELEKKLQEAFKKGLQVDETKKIYNLVKKAKKILFVPDNVGEIAIDKLFISHLNNYCKKIIVGLRGGPITSDATVSDGIQVQIPDVADEVILTGADTLGILFEEMSCELQKALITSDLIFTKGQANYYAFSEYKNKIPAKIVCLFTTKCDVVSKIFGYSGKINIAKII